MAYQSFGSVVWPQVPEEPPTCDKVEPGYVGICFGHGTSTWVGGPPPATLPPCHAKTEADVAYNGPCYYGGKDNSLGWHTSRLPPVPCDKMGDQEHKYPSCFLPNGELVKSCFDTRGYPCWEDGSYRTEASLSRRCPGGAVVGAFFRGPIAAAAIALASSSFGWKLGWWSLPAGLALGAAIGCWKGDNF